MDNRARYLFRIWWAVALLVVVQLLPSTAAHALDTISASVKGHTLSLEVARTEAQRAQGLMYRREMARDAGMLFVFPTTEIHEFWMKNTPLSLDMIFLDEHKAVVGVAPNTIPYSTRRVLVINPSRYVIEVNAGVAKKLGIELGTKVEFQE